MFKENVHNLISNQFFVGFTYFVLALFLVPKNISPLYTLFSITFMTFYSYFIHIVFHIIPYLRETHLIHHEGKILSEVFDLLYETLLNIFFFALLYFFQELTNIKIVPKILIIYAGLVYTSGHIINYSIFKVNDIHEKHHIKEDDMYKYNFGPDIIDHIMGTTYNKDYENLRHVYPNLLLSYFFTKMISPLI